MEWSDLLTYVREGETLSTKFLARVSHEKDVCPYITGMATTIGGKIFIGIDVKNYHFVGSDLSASWIHNVISKYCAPNIPVDIETIKREGRSILCLTVPEGPQKPYFFEEECFIMDQSQPRLASEIEVREMKKNQSRGERLIDKSMETLPEPGLSSSGSSETAAYTDMELDLKTITDELIDLQQSTETPVESSDEAVVPPMKDVFEEMASFDSPSIDPVMETAVLESQVQDVASISEAKSSSVEVQSSFSILNDVPLNHRQEKSLDYFKDHEFIKNKDYRHLFDVSHKTAHIELVDLMKKGYIYQEGAGRSTCYKRNQKQSLL